MNPNDLRRRVEEALLASVDPEEWERLQVVEEAERETMRKFARTLAS